MIIVCLFRGRYYFFFGDTSTYINLPNGVTSAFIC